MFQLAQTTTATRAAVEATDGVTNFFVLLAAVTFVAVVLRLMHAGELGSVLTTVGSVITAVVVVTVISMIVFVVLVAVNALLTF